MNLMREVKLLFILFKKFWKKEKQYHLMIV